MPHRARRLRRVRFVLEPLELRAVPAALIAEIDTGVDLNAKNDSVYYDLADGYDAVTLVPVTQNGVENPSIIQDTSLPNGHGHGATVADSIVDGILAADPGATSAQAQIIPILDSSSGSNPVIDAGAAIRGVYWAVYKGASVINISAEGVGDWYDYDTVDETNTLPGVFPEALYGTTLTQAIEYAGEHGAIVVTGPGNQAENINNADLFPAQAGEASLNGLGVPLDNVLDAAAVNSSGNLSAVSNWGAVVVDFGALDPTGQGATSYSAGYTSGVAGAVASQTPNLSADARVALLDQTVQPQSQSVGAWSKTGGVLEPAAAFSAAESANFYLTAGQSIESQNGQYVLRMQADGNLVEYGPSNQVIWDAGTAGNSGDHAIMQGDGNLVVYSSTGTALWNSGTSGNAGAYFFLSSNGNAVISQSNGTALWYGNSTALSGRVITTGQEIFSPNGQYHLIMQPDGNLVEYGPSNQVIWDAVTAGNSGDHAVMQADGNLVVYSSTGTALWYSNTAGNAGAYFQLQNNGNAVIFQANGTALWYGNSTALSGRVITTGQEIFSPNGQYHLIMQPDGNLVEYGPGNQVMWNAGTAGHSGDYAVMQSDGNLVVYSSAGTALWYSNTSGYDGATLVLNNAGKLEIIYQGVVIWSV